MRTPAHWARQVACLNPEGLLARLVGVGRLKLLEFGAAEAGRGGLVCFHATIRQVRR
jgi:hypothetical protein